MSSLFCEPDRFPQYNDIFCKDYNYKYVFHILSLEQFHLLLENKQPRDFVNWLEYWEYKHYELQKACSNLIP
jgi:hypothetical protein